MVEDDRRDGREPVMGAAVRQEADGGLGPQHPVDRARWSRCRAVRIIMRTPARQRLRRQRAQRLVLVLDVGVEVDLRHHASRQEVEPRRREDAEASSSDRLPIGSSASLQPTCRLGRRIAWRSGSSMPAAHVDAILLRVLRASSAPRRLRSCVRAPRVHQERGQQRHRPPGRAFVLARAPGGAGDVQMRPLVLLGEAGQEAGGGDAAGRRGRRCWPCPRTGS